MERIKVLLKHIEVLESELRTVCEEVEQEKSDIFNAIIENSPGFISIVQEEKFVFVNSNGLQIIGHKNPHDMIGLCIFDIFPGNYRTIIRNRIEIAHVNKTHPSIQTEMLKTDGTCFLAELNFTSFSYNARPAVLIMGRDITEEQESIRIIRKEEKLRADILNSFDELIAFYEPDHKIRWLNNAAKKQLGITDDSYIGKRCYHVWYKSSRPCSGCPAVSKSHESSERITTRGDNRSWLVRHTPLIDSDGNLSGYIEFSTDITEKQEQERIRRQLAADALYLSQKNKITLEIRSELDKIIASHKNLSQKTFKMIYDIIGSYTRFDDDWELLKTHFEQVHPDFFKRLKQNHPNLSVNDIKHCACIKLNLDTKETARFFNVKPDSIQMSRVRLKKKMRLPETTDLRTFISNL